MFHATRSTILQHKNRTKEFGREKDQRKALWKTMLGSLVMHEKITTTEAKAKELKSRIDKVINKSKKYKAGKEKVTAIRELKKDLPEMAAKKIAGVFLDKFEKRKSGYARVIKLAPRHSDGARMAVIEFV